MKNYRLIYSKFTSKIVDQEYVTRSSWIGLFGFFLIIFNAFEAESGFAGQLSIEGYVIFITLAIFFYLNYLSQTFNAMKTLLAIVSIFSALINCVFAFKVFKNIHYHFASILLLIIYSLGIFIIVSMQMNFFDLSVSFKPK